MSQPTLTERLNWCVESGLTTYVIANEIGLSTGLMFCLLDGQPVLIPPECLDRLIALSNHCRDRSAPKYPRDDAFVPGPLLASRASKPEPSAQARNLETAIRERLSRIGQKAVSEASGVDRTKICRMLNAEHRAGLTIDELGGFLEALGLTVIESDGELVQLPREEYDALRTFARKGLE